MANLTRRDAFKATAVAGLGLVPAVNVSASHNPKPKAERLVLINLLGGPSQLDSWDPKPDAASEYRSPFGTIATRTPGIRFTSLFPKMAAISNDFAIIRTVNHTFAPVHEIGLRLFNTGVHTTGDTIASPLGVSLGGREALLCSNGVDCGINTPVGLERKGQSIKPVCFMVQCHRAVKALEAGMKTVTLSQFSSVFNEPTWDCHNVEGALPTTMVDIQHDVAPEFDHAFSKLIATLKARGLLDTTLVIATGEFGRTPKMNATGGRDHWAKCWTAIVAGGGVTGGTVVGSSDAIGAEPKDRPVDLADLAATAAFALGQTIPGCVGNPVKDLFV